MVCCWDGWDGGGARLRLTFILPAGWVRQQLRGGNAGMTAGTPSSSQVSGYGTAGSATNGATHARLWAHLTEMERGDAMNRCGSLILVAILISQGGLLLAQNPNAIVQQAVQTELQAAKNDHSCWMFFEDDRTATDSVRQWVAQTHDGDVKRIIEQDGKRVSRPEQRQIMNNFLQNQDARARQRKSGQHDDEQAAEMLRLLPRAFIWNITGTRNGETMLHFKPDPNFHPPDWETRVFAAMEGEMVVNNAEHRIVTLKGRMIHDVRFFGGLLGDLKAGGTFDVERRMTGDSVWQITETHVHIQGSALLFKNISQNEDDVKSQFRQLPNGISLNQAEDDLLKRGG